MGLKSLILFSFVFAGSAQAGEVLQVTSAKTTVSVYQELLAEVRISVRGKDCQNLEFEWNKESGERRRFVQGFALATCLLPISLTSQNIQKYKDQGYYVSELNILDRTVGHGKKNGLLRADFESSDDPKMYEVHLQFAHSLFSEKAGDRHYSFKMVDAEKAMRQIIEQEDFVIGIKLRKSHTEKIELPYESANQAAAVLKALGK